MLKRLIEVALPLKEVSEQSAREKSIRHGHISTLHIWWARRPLAACRAVVFASLIPDPDDPDCPEHFRQLVRAELGDSQFKPKNGNGGTVEDTPRNRCLEFIKYLVRWENSNEPFYIEPARKLIAAAHKIFNPEAKDGEMPKVLDPFAGGGAIPLEALRLGCEAYAIDINPVAHLIQLCTLVYPQKYGKPLPPDKDIPDYIKRLIAHNKKNDKGKSCPTLFDKKESAEPVESDDLIPDVEISEAEYRKNPLAADVKYWGHWVLAHAKKELEQFYPADEDGSIPVAYLWARTVKCPNPACGAIIPLYRQLWLCNKKGKKVAMEMQTDSDLKKCKFKIIESLNLSVNPDQITMQRGNAQCPLCNQIAPVSYLRDECRSGRMNQQIMAVIKNKPTERGKHYREAQENDEKLFAEASKKLSDIKSKNGDNIIPTEPLPPVGTLGFRVNNYGLLQWGDLFNPRQNLSLVTFTKHIKLALENAKKIHNEAYVKAIGSYLGCSLSRLADQSSNLVVWITQLEAIAHVFNRQALPMTWDYVEGVPIGNGGGTFSSAIAWVQMVVKELDNNYTNQGYCRRGSATTLPIEDDEISAVVTDPPYYDAVPYADLSDFFYVWLKRSIGEQNPDIFSTPLTPKSQELVSHLGETPPGGRKNTED